MRTIVRRVGRLEDRFQTRLLARLEQSCTPIAHLRWKHLAEVLWERRQRRLKAEGLPFETVKPQYPPRPHMSFAESLRRAAGQLVSYGREARLTHTIARRLKQLETRAKEVAAAHPEPHTLRFISTDQKVVSTYEMATGKWTHFDPPRDRAEFEPMV